MECWGKNCWIVSKKHCKVCEAPYCSEKCQKENWKTHKLVCRKYLYQRLKCYLEFERNGRKCIEGIGSSSIDIMGNFDNTVALFPKDERIQILHFP